MNVRLIASRKNKGVRVIGGGGDHGSSYVNNQVLYNQVLYNQILYNQAL